MTGNRSLQYTRAEHYVRDYVSRGLIVLDPESLGVPMELHQSIFTQELAAFQRKERITAEVVPDIMRITSAPGVVAACEQLIGKNFAIVPFTHNTPFMSGSNDQHWHKDDNGPYNMRKQRHHQAIQLEMLYYPQEVKADMGPTATVPYSQYWTFNHEENHDNFAGADHLDFAYQLTGMERIPISGPRSDYAKEDIVNQTTEHDIRMRQAVMELDWPLCQPFEAGPLKAGSVILYSHNLLHHGNHRRDDWHTWKSNPRFMWRFWLYRTTEGDQPVSSEDWSKIRLDEMTGQRFRDLPEDVCAIWRTQHRWLANGEYAETRADSGDFTALTAQLYASGEKVEPKRIGAAYRLAEHPDRDSAVAALGTALQNDRESVRRAALYGLIAVGEDATSELLRAAKSDARWVRKAGVFGLGSSGVVCEEVIEVLAHHLLHDPSVYVRSVAADALGSLGRRAICGASADLVVSAVIALVASLQVEVNRLSMDRVQGRSIKQVRPTDECDVCEGIGFDYGQERFEPVRSVVRENSLWAMVMVCSHGADKLGNALEEVIETMRTVIEQDQNVFSVGLAMDVLQRLISIPCANPEPSEVKKLRLEIGAIFAHTPIYSLEALVASGMDLEHAVSAYASTVLSKS